jgi:hypothetical protein
LYKLETQIVNSDGFMVQEYVKSLEKGMRENEYYL